MSEINITWPDILNYLADRGYFTSLSPIENKLHDALLIKLNTLFFPEYLEISNTELHGLTGLSIRAIIQARNSLVKKQCYDSWVWQYESRERQRLSGHYFFNYELIRNWIVTRQVLKRNWQSTKQENVPIEHTQNDNDHNKTQSQLKETTNHNSNNLVVDDGDFYKDMKEEIINTLRRIGLADSKIQESVNLFGWEKVSRAFCSTREKYSNNEIGNFAGYFLNTVKNLQDE